MNACTLFFVMADACTYMSVCDGDEMFAPLYAFFRLFFFSFVVFGRPNRRTFDRSPLSPPPAPANLLLRGLGRGYGGGRRNFCLC